MTDIMTTKEKIRDAAFNLISESGYTGTSIRNIANQVGIRESAIYNHFSSKEEIFNFVLDHYKSRTQVSDLLTPELLDEISKPEKFLKRFCEQLLTRWSNPDELKFLRIILKEQFNVSANLSYSLDDHLNEFGQIWIMIFTQMIKFGFIKKFDPEIIANEFAAPLFFIRIKYLSNEKSATLKSALREVNNHIEFFWNSIKK